MAEDRIEDLDKEEIHRIIENCFINSPAANSKRFLLLVLIVIAGIALPPLSMYISDEITSGIAIMLITLLILTSALFLLGRKKWNREQEAVILLVEHHINSGKKIIPRKSWKLIPKEFLEEHGYK